MPRLLIAALLTALLTACGQTGPLYLPKEDPNATATPQPPAAEEQSDVAVDETATDEAVAPSEEASASDETP
ncbi:MAG: lipoprotein [Pseudomonadales bacterium]